MFSCENCEIFKNSFFYRTPLVDASVGTCFYQAGKAKFNQDLINRGYLLFNQ